MNEIDQLLSSWKQSVELSPQEIARIERTLVGEVLEPSSPEWWKSIFAIDLDIRVMAA